ncbi:MULTISPECIES: LamG-like jellyroll fold domain-containing protein [unclassified Streptomyces]|uniref:LamG-like jellyroll fold domain-containing protein n=1 Tax=unclassified Streptomyces TaxID=2593676 RepID=UPI002E1D519A
MAQSRRSENSGRFSTSTRSTNSRYACVRRNGLRRRRCATRTAQLYVNGAPAGTATGVTPWAATGSLVLGRGLYNGSQDDWTNGSVSGVQAYDYALTANQVAALYQSIP